MKKLWFSTCLFSFIFHFGVLAQPKKHPLKDSLDNLIFANQYPKALPIAERWLQYVKEEKGENNVDYWIASGILGECLLSSKRRVETESLLVSSLAWLEKKLGSKHTEVADARERLAWLYMRKPNYKGADSLLTLVLEMRLKLLGPAHLKVGSVYRDLAINQSYQGNYKKAEEFFKMALENRLNMEKPSPDMISVAYGNLGAINFQLGQFSNAFLFYQKGLDILLKTYGEDNIGVPRARFNIGQLHLRRSNFPEAEPNLLLALSGFSKLQGPDHPNVGAVYNGLANLNSFLSRFTQAELYYKKSVEIRIKALGENHPDVAESYDNLAAINNKLGNYKASEKYRKQALDIYIKVFGENHRDVGRFYSNQGSFYFTIGDYTRAEKSYLKALDILRQALGDSHIVVGSTYQALASNYGILKKYKAAEKYGREALRIARNAIGGESTDAAELYRDLGAIKEQMGEFEKADSLMKESIRIYRKVLPKGSFGEGVTLYNMGTLYGKMGKSSASLSCFLQAKQLMAQSAGKDHPQIAYPLISIANQYFNNHEKEEFKKALTEFKSNQLSQISRYFPTLSDLEKGNYFNNVLKGNFERFNSLCIEQGQKSPEFLGLQYDVTIATKGVLLNNAARWKSRIKNSGDSGLISLFNVWSDVQNQIAKAYSSTDSTTRAGLDSLIARSEAMEKELALKAEQYGNLYDKKLYKWKEVQALLKPGEVAVEIVRVNKFGISRTLTDTSDPKKPVYKIKGLTDTIYYAALIVKPESIYPEMVLLKNGNDLEGRHLMFYQNSISKKLPDNQSYGKYWDKIGTKLGTSTRVYFSPDGVFHQINLNTLFNPKTKKYLVEEKDIRLLTSTKDLVNPSIAEEENKLAQLVGFPSFYVSEPTSSIMTTERKSPVMSYHLNLETVGNLAELPGTKIEISKISEIFASKGWEVKNYTDGQALEENIKESYKPRVLHIATHGFFQPDTTKGSNPLLRSGLMLTGAGSTLKGEKSESGEDGILTAYEAMNLNLDNTDLVVLSACETGLGEIKNGEGVYGLQRAFKVAGAKSIIMSLWKVDDEATQELMVAFYKNWLAGTSKRMAFLKAQKELKGKYPNPYYWGAFVMVGE